MLEQIIGVLRRYNALDIGSISTVTDLPRLNHQQQEIIDYLPEENRVLRDKLGNRRLRLNDDQRQRLAVRAKKLGRLVLHELATLVTPETILA